MRAAGDIISDYKDEDANAEENATKETHAQQRDYFTVAVMKQLLATLAMEHCGDPYERARAPAEASAVERWARVWQQWR